MNLKHIKILLDKYYKAETSEKEEKILFDFFLKNKVPKELRNEYVFFSELFREKKDILDKEDLNSLIDLSIQKFEKKRKSGIKVYKNYLILGIAASILLLIGIYFVFNIFIRKEKEQIAFEGTYQNPEEAYLEAKKALFLVSEKLNYGMSKMNLLSKLNQSISHLNHLSKFNEGVIMVKNISKFEKLKEDIK